MKRIALLIFAIFAVLPAFAATFPQLTDQPSPLGTDFLVGYRSTTDSRFQLSALWSGYLKSQADAVYSPLAHTHTLSQIAQSGATTGQVATWNGTSWVPAAATGGMTNPMTAAGDLIVGGSSGAPTRVAAGTNGYVLTLSSGLPVWAAPTGGGGSGTVTSVALTAPSWLAVSGSPVTTSGTIAVTAATGQAANQVLATPNGSSGAVAPRALVGADLPAVNLASTSNGGVTGVLTPTNGGSPEPIRLAQRVHFPIGLKIRGANVVVNPSNQNWNYLWAAGWDWTGWVKPQIDLAKGLGANCIRCIGGIRSVIDGTQTRAQYFAKQAQFIEYCASQGMYVYACGGDYGQLGATYDSVLDTTVKAELVAYAQFVDKYPNVIGLDVMQEMWYSHPSGWTNTQVNTQNASWAAAIRAVCNVPITFSNPTSVNNNSAAMWAATTDAAAAAAYCDFMDCHIYYGATYSEMAAFVGAIGGLPILIGETGSVISAGTTVNANHYTAILNLLNSTNASQIIGAFSWSIVDQGTTTAGSYGMYTSSFVERPSTTTVFKTWPKVDLVSSLPSQTGNAGKVLSTDGTNATWSTGLTLPSQSGNSGKFLTTDGSTTSWATTSGGGNNISASVTYYGSSTGNDSNNGLSSGAPKTIQGMLNMVSSKTIDAGVTVTMQLADGTYAMSTTSLTFPKFYGDGVVVVQGNLTNKSAVVITSSAGSTVSVMGGQWQAKFMSFSGSSLFLFNCAGGTFSIGNSFRIASGSTFTYHFYVTGGGRLAYAGDLTLYYVEASAFRHFYISGAGSFASFNTAAAVTIDCGGNTVAMNTLLGMQALAYAELYNPSNAVGTTNGSITGRRSDISSNSVALFFGSGTRTMDTFWPGTVSSVTSTGGIVLAP